MIYRGHVKGGVIVLEPPGELPEGAAVDVKLAEGPARGEPLDPAFSIGDLAVDMGECDLDSDAVARRMDAGTISGGIPDLARNLDHYLYGHPKVEDDPLDDQDHPVDQAPSVGDGAVGLGAEIEGDPNRSPADRRSLLFRMLDMAGPTDIPDLSRNIDHYLYGHPKVNDE